MTGLASHVIESMSHYPDGVQDMWAFGGALAAGAVASVISRKAYNHTEEGFAAEFPNAALADEVIEPGVVEARRSRMLPLYGQFAGACLLAAQIFGVPSYETTHPNPQAHVVVLEDVSRSMDLTKDLGAPGVSRDQAALAAMKAASYSGNLTVMPVGEGPAHLAFPMGIDWRSHISSVNGAEVDQNGTQLVQATETAASILPENKKGDHEGTIIIVSDGTIDDSAASLGAEAVKLKKEGVGLQVVVPGTEDSHYTLPGYAQRYGSGVHPETFSQIPQNEVSTATTVTELNKELNRAIHDAGTIHQKHRWYWPGVAGGVLLAGSFLADKWQRIRRIV